jgi:DNA-binding NarL/FixJ family response regulator
LNSAAGAHHEKADGTGYHKGLRANAIPRPGRLLAAVEVYVGLTTERADRPAFSADDAAAALRELASRGVIERAAADAVLAKAGHQKAPKSAGGAQRPGGLSRREVEVLCLAAMGLTTREIADRLFISPKTADHHIQHVYTKIDVSTRAAAALWAMQHELVQ